MGMLLSSNDAAPAGRGRAAYAYDPLYQLSSVTGGDPAAPVVRNYGYVNHLNLARMDEANAVFAFDDAMHPDRIAGMTVGGGARRDLAYDANGNLLGLAGKTFAFNQKNELVRVTRADGTVARYAYDPKGQRASKTVTDKLGAATTTLFAGAEVEIRGGTTFHFVHLGERRVALLSAGEPRFVHGDYAGNTVFFSSANGVEARLRSCTARSATSSAPTARSSTAPTACTRSMRSRDCTTCAGATTRPSWGASSRPIRSRCTRCRRSPAIPRRCTRTPTWGAIRSTTSTTTGCRSGASSARSWG